jgi:phage terminase large subunit
LPSEINLEKLINPTERQREFLAAIAQKDYVLYGGAAGGGKSYILRWWLVCYLSWLFKTKGLRNVQAALLCEDYPALYDRQISKIKFEFPPEIGQLKEGTVKNFQLRPEFGGGIIALRNLDDPSKYQSAEFAAIAVDELTKNSKETFDFLRFRLRWPGIDRPKFAGATNP